MHRGDPPRDRETRELSHDERVMLEELLIVPTVGEIAIVRRVVIQPAEGRRIYREVNPFGWQCLHDFDAVAVVDRVAIRDHLRLYSHAGASSITVNRSAR